MKLPLMLCLVLAFAAASAPSSAQAPEPEYQWTVRDIAGDRAVAWSVRTLGNGTRLVQIAARWQTERAASGNARAHFGSMTGWQPDCANGNVLRIADRFYDAGGNQTQHFAGTPEWIAFADTGLNEPIFRAFCGDGALPTADQVTVTTGGVQLWLAEMLKAATPQH